MRIIDRMPGSIAVLLIGLSVGGVARASEPTAIYTVPSRLEFIPDEASATKVVIHGAFFFRNANGGYDAPMCGYMYFACQPGQEAMCRMQWQDIKRAIGQAWCAGFGEWNMVSKVKLQPDGASLGTADTWLLGMGIGTGVYVDAKCDPARALQCGVSHPDNDGFGPAPFDDGVWTPVDMSSPAVNPPLAQGKGCAVGGHGSGGAASLAGLGLVLALAVRRRRR